jgi:predicted DNA-binding transcriptional regulator YafY
VNRIDRLVAILIYLQGRRVTRAEDIAEEFETSIRTVYRDITDLAEAGVPIIGEAGVGYSIVKGYHLPPVHFTTEEATALITASMLMDHFADRSLMSSMTSALAKKPGWCDFYHRRRKLELVRWLAAFVRRSDCCR